MTDDYAICLLAGGLARRMGGGDKGEICINGKTILAHLIGRFAPRPDAAPYMVLNANGDASRFAHYGLPIISDILLDHQGPLSGIYTAMHHLRAARPEVKWLITLPTDAPLLPASLVDDLREQADATSAMLVSVKSHGRTHPVIGLWSLSVFAALEQALLHEGVRKIDLFTAAHNCRYIDYDGVPDPFLNLNRPDDLEAFHASLQNK